MTSRLLCAPASTRAGRAKKLTARLSNLMMLTTLIYLYLNNSVQTNCFIVKLIMLHSVWYVGPYINMATRMSEKAGMSHLPGDR